MTKRTLMTLSLAVIGIICLFVAGCSEDRIIYTNAGEAQASLSEIQVMFPATTGYQSIYEVSQSNGLSEIVTYTVGEEVSFGYGTAHEMHVRSSSGERYTNYFVFSDSALYFYEYWSDDAEKVLSLPLRTGSTWNKNDEVGSITYDTANVQADTSKGGGETDPNEPKDGDDSILGKNFPGNNAGTFTIETTESLTLSNGDVYSGSIRVRNDNGGELVNYYWFAEGVGLVRWVLRANSDNIYEGTEVGEKLL